MSFDVSRIAEVSVKKIELWIIASNAIQLHLVVIFFMTFFYRDGGTFLDNAFTLSNLHLDL